MANVLVAEDDDLIAELVNRSLSGDNHKVDIYSDGEKGFQAALAGNYELAVLDIMLPNKSGLEICRDLRSKDKSIAILFLTARHSEEARVQGLEMGADDYLVKPFSYKELNARVNALLRRPRQSRVPVLEVGRLKLDRNSNCAYYKNSELTLRKKEFQLLEQLMLRPGEIITKSELLKSVWGVAPKNSSNRLEACMKNLRKALAEFGIDTKITTVRNMGYRLSR